MGGLAARIKRGKEGNGRGARGIFIGQKKEGNRCVNLRNSCGGNLVRDERVQRLEDEDSDVIADVTCGAHLSVFARKKRREARGVRWLFTGWACAVDVGLAQLAGDAAAF